MPLLLVVASFFSKSTILPMFVNSSNIKVVSTFNLPSTFSSANFINFINKNEKNNVDRKSKVEFVSLVITNIQVFFVPIFSKLISSLLVIFRILSI